MKFNPSLRVNEIFAPLMSRLSLHGRLQLMGKRGKPSFKDKKHHTYINSRDSIHRQLIESSCKAPRETRLILE